MLLCIYFRIKESSENIDLQKRSNQVIHQQGSIFQIITNPPYTFISELLEIHQDPPIITKDFIVICDICLPPYTFLGCRMIQAFIKQECTNKMGTKISPPKVFNHISS